MRELEMPQWLEALAAYWLLFQSHDEFSSQHQGGSSQPPVTVVPDGFFWYADYMQTKHPYT